MKHIILSMLQSFALLFLCVGCNTPQKFPEGSWQSPQGRPSLIFEQDSCGNYYAIIQHSTADGRICPVSYPVVRQSTGKYYIQAEGRIYLSYSSEDSTLFLSPGGIYFLLNDATFSDHKRH